MNGSPSSVLTLGLGDWGSVGLLITIGFGIGADSVSGANGPARSFAAFNSIISGHAAFVSVVNASTGIAK